MADFRKRQFGKRDSGRGGSDRGRDRDSGSKGGFGRDRDSPSRFGRDRMGGGDRPGFQKTFRVTCDKCGKDCDVPFKPTGDKPVYCSDCFRKNGNSEKKSKKYDDFQEFDRMEKKAPNSQSNEELKKRLDDIEEKIDKILDSLGLNE